MWGPGQNPQTPPICNWPVEPSFSGSRVISGGAAPATHTAFRQPWCYSGAPKGHERGKGGKFSTVLSWCSQKRLALNTGARLTRRKSFFKSTVQKPRLSLGAFLFLWPNVSLVIGEWYWSILVYQGSCLARKSPGQPTASVTPLPLSSALMFLMRSTTSSPKNGTKNIT